MSNKNDTLKGEARICAELMLKEYRRRLETAPEKIRAADMGVIRQLVKDLGIQPAADHPVTQAFADALASIDLPDGLGSVPEEFRGTDNSPKH